MKQLKPTKDFRKRELSTAFLQAFVTTPIYERFFEDKIGGFIDLCSTCNISILMLRCSLYGHYIHGRTVHARSDVGLQQMHENFAKEEVGVVESGDVDVV